MFNTFRGAIAVAVAFASLGAACGSGEARPPDTNPPVSSTTTQPPSTTTTPPVAPCSARGLDVASDQAGLPVPVADTRRAIADAAIRCDFAELGRLASIGERDFTYSFGGGGNPEAFWNDAEAHGTAATRLLVELLGKTYGTRETQFEADVFTPIYFWPAVFGDNPTDADWDEVSDLYDEDEIAAMKQFGGYAGHRIGITADGEWVFFVSGD